MTAPDVRTAAREKATEIFIPLDRPTSVTDQVAVQSFVDGAVWGAALVTPTREQIAEAIARSADPEYGIVDDVDLAAAAAVLALSREEQAAENRTALSCSHPAT